MRVVHKIPEFKINQVESDKNTYIGWTAYLRAKKPEFNREKLIEMLQNNNFDPDYAPEMRSITKFKKGAKNILGKSIRSVVKEGDVCYLQTDETIVEEISGYKSKRTEPEITFKFEDEKNFECSIAKKDEIEQEMERCANDLSTSAMFKTIQKIIEREFTGAFPIEGNYWYIAASDENLARMADLEKLLEEIGPSTRVMIIPVLDNPKNRKSYWELLCEDIENKVEKLSEKIDDESTGESLHKVKSLFNRFYNEKIVLQSYREMFETQAADLEEKISELQDKMRIKFKIDDLDDEEIEEVEMDDESPVEEEKEVDEIIKETFKKEPSKTVEKPITTEEKKDGEKPKTATVAPKPAAKPEPEPEPEPELDEEDEFAAMLAELENS